MTIERYNTPLQIDIESILRKRGKGHLPLPTFIIKWIKHIIRQEKLNDILQHAFPQAGYAFAKTVLNYLSITLQINGLENIDNNSRYVFASNHPLGGLDGIALIAILGEKYGDNAIRFLVNDMLMNVRPLENIFVPINKYGAQSRLHAARINQEYTSNNQILIFPAGLVSRLNDKGQIRDLTWHKNFFLKAKHSNRLIVPIHFQAANTKKFYNIARWRKQLGIKTNIEQIMLPAQLIAARGKKFTITFGKPINPHQLDNLPPQQAAQEIKNHVYAL